MKHLTVKEKEKESFEKQGFSVEKSTMQKIEFYKPFYDFYIFFLFIWFFLLY